jgi:hypothetical protein
MNESEQSNDVQGMVKEEQSILGGQSMDMAILQKKLSQMKILDEQILKSKGKNPLKVVSHLVFRLSYRLSYLVLG